MGKRTYDAVYGIKLDNWEQGCGYGTGKIHNTEKEAKQEGEWYLEVLSEQFEGVKVDNIYKVARGVFAAYEDTPNKRLILRLDGHIEERENPGEFYILIRENVDDMPKPKHKDIKLPDNKFTRLLEVKELVKELNNQGCVLFYLDETSGLRMQKRETEIHLIIESNRMRLCIHDDGLGLPETDRIRDLSGRILMKYGYRKGTNILDAGGRGYYESEDEYYKYYIATE